MNIEVELIPLDKQEELIVHCHNKEERWVENVLNAAQQESMIIGKKDGLSYRININDVYYFEVVDDRSFMYTKQNVYEITLRLYEFEQKTKDLMFFRSSKSNVVNIRKIKCVKPSLSGKFELTLLNDYKLLVSRRYVAELKRMINI